jgi:hypothetical protein
MTQIPDYGFTSQAMRCDKEGKHTTKCLSVCDKIAAFVDFDPTKKCQRETLYRGIKGDAYYQLEFSR